MSEPSISQIILEELRELRASHNESARATGERLSALESSLKSVVGNGQPGRLGHLESKVSGLAEKVEKLSGWRYWVVGAGAGAFGLLSFGLKLLLGGH